VRRVVPCRGSTTTGPETPRVAAGEQPGLPILRVLKGQHPSNLHAITLPQRHTPCQPSTQLQDSAV
jgi:hypothetical protein